MILAISIGVEIKSKDTLWAIEYSLEELSELAKTADIDVVYRMTQARETPHPKYYVGTGKLEEIKSISRKFRHKPTTFKIPNKILKLLESFHGKAVHAGDIAPVVRAYCPIISNAIKFEQLNRTSATEMLNTIKMMRNILSTDPWCHIRT